MSVLGFWMGRLMGAKDGEQRVAINEPGAASRLFHDIIKVCCRTR
jgi:hypothetical protein